MTPPVDRRLATRANQTPDDPFVVRAEVAGDAAIDVVEVYLDDRDRIGDWPDRGILVIQPGPNRRGREW